MRSMTSLWCTYRYIWTDFKYLFAGKKLKSWIKVAVNVKYQLCRKMYFILLVEQESLGWLRNSELVVRNHVKAMTCDQYSRQCHLWKWPSKERKCNSILYSLNCWLIGLNIEKLVNFKYPRFNFLIPETEPADLWNNFVFDKVSLREFSEMS